MESKDLTKEQATVVSNRLRPTLGYITRLRRRMVQQGFPDHDPLMVAVLDTEKSLDALCFHISHTAGQAYVRRKHQK